MSLRDQLMAKGLVSEKRAKQIARELKDERKSDQAQRDGKRTREAEEARAREEAAAAALAARLEARRVAQAEIEARESVQRVRQIVQANRVGAKGPIPFHHRRVDGPSIGLLWLSEHAARDLRAGRLGIAGYVRDDGHADHAVVTERAAHKLAEVAPGALVHWVTDAEHFSDPSQSLMRREWETSLRPHRVREPA